MAALRTNRNPSLSRSLLPASFILFNFFRVETFFAPSLFHLQFHMYFLSATPRTNNNENEKKKRKKEKSSSSAGYRTGYAQSRTRTRLRLHVNRFHSWVCLSSFFWNRNPWALATAKERRVISHFFVIYDCCFGLARIEIIIFFFFKQQNAIHRTKLLITHAHTQTLPIYGSVNGRSACAHSGARRWVFNGSIKQCGKLRSE